MSEKIKPSVYVQLGDDGNPEIKVVGTMHDAALLCVALMAGLTAQSGEDPAKYLVALATNAADLLERMEDNSNEED